MEVKQKWVKENGVFYPIPGDTTLHVTPGTGVFQIYEEKETMIFKVKENEEGLFVIDEEQIYDFTTKIMGFDEIQD